MPCEQSGASVTDPAAGCVSTSQSTLSPSGSLTDGANPTGDSGTVCNVAPAALGGELTRSEVSTSSTGATLAPASLLANVAAAVTGEFITMLTVPLPVMIGVMSALATPPTTDAPPE